ncbi:MAG: polyprenyl synthetase family protein [Deltaproteobacteria bacterium]|nr:polyprenyl synthetase family protein [Deltaproteobacteria bacterium]
MTHDDAVRSLDQYLKEQKAVIDRALDSYLPAAETYPPVIFESMRYSVFAGGKRLRPILCVAAAEAVRGREETVLPVACALEMIHTYSLIHDDLPAMDDDDYRRGRPTNHKVFGDGIAILAGDALLTEAFSLMSRRDLMTGVNGERLLQVIAEVSRAAGCFGMIGGQVADLQSEGAAVDEETLHYIHVHKTEALISVSLRAGSLLSEGRDDELAALTEYGKKIGLAFQIADDILDIESTREVLGKDIGSDQEKNKMTYPALFGIERSRRKAGELVQGALADLERFDERAWPLRAIANFIVDRKS